MLYCYGKLSTCSVAMVKHAVDEKLFYHSEMLVLCCYPLHILCCYGKIMIKAMLPLSNVYALLLW